MKNLNLLALCLCCLLIWGCPSVQIPVAQVPHMSPKTKGPSQHFLDSLATQKVADSLADKRSQDSLRVFKLAYHIQHVYAADSILPNEFKIRLSLLLKQDLDLGVVDSMVVQSELSTHTQFLEWAANPSSQKLLSSFTLSDSALENQGLSIIGVGDMMLGTTYPSKKYLSPEDGHELLKPVQSILMNADLTFGNLEGVLLNGKGRVKRCSNPAVCYAFKSPEHYAKYFVNVGFDVLSVANNHVNDFGAAGKKATARVLTKNGLHFAGLKSHPFSLFEKNGVKYGFMAVSPNTGTIRINNYENAVKIVKHLDSLADVVIVSFHGGGEGIKHKHITKRKEIFLREDRGNPYEFARLVIDAGADIVFGHGPHVVRAVDVYKDRFIIYSLGNFATYARFSLSGAKGYAPILKVFVTPTGKFKYARIFAFKQTGEGGPMPDSTFGAIKEIQMLTKKDLPEAKLVVRDDGLIFPQ